MSSTSASAFALTSKVALVTGASAGVGRAVAERFLASGARVVAIDVDGAGLDEIRRIQPHDQVLCVVADVSDSRAVDDAVAAALQRWDRLDIVAAVAGISRVAPMADMTTAERDLVFAVNFFGVWNTVRASLAALIAQGPGGRIIACGSVECVLGSAGLSAYVASKHAVLGLIKSVALELAPAGITANVISPAAVDTDLLRRVVPPEGVQRLRDTTPVPRLSTAAEIAAFFEFVAGPDTGYLTGENIVIDGGLKLVNAHAQGASWASVPR